MTHDQRNALHELRSTPVVTGRMLLIEYAVTVWIPVFCIREVLTTRQPIDEIIQLLFISAMAVIILGWLTRSWLETRLYGESVCRLSALPAPDARSFEAEIECSMPLDSRAPIVVRLESRTAVSKFPRRHWQVEREIDPREIRTLDLGRVTVPVRLDIPARGPAGGRSGAVWALEITRSRAGMNFRAEFVMPLIEAAHESANELLAH